MTEEPTIGPLLEGYLTQRRSKITLEEYRSEVNVVDLLRGYLNRFGYNELEPAERERFDRAFFGEGNPEAFCDLYGAPELTARVPTFLDEYLPNRVRADPSVVSYAKSVTADLVAWLGT